MNPAFEHLILTDEIGESILLRFLINEHFYVMYVVYAVMCTCVVYAINMHTITLTYYVYNGHLRRPVTLVPIAVELSLSVFMTYNIPTLGILTSIVFINTASLSTKDMFLSIYPSYS